jgi:hypothetical protein
VGTPAGRQIEEKHHLHYVALSRVQTSAGLALFGKMLPRDYLQHKPCEELVAEEQRLQLLSIDRVAHPTQPHAARPSLSARMSAAPSSSLSPSVSVPGNATEEIAAVVTLRLSVPSPNAVITVAAPMQQVLPGLGTVASNAVTMQQSAVGMTQPPVQDPPRNVATIPYVLLRDPGWMHRGMLQQEIMKPFSIPRDSGWVDTCCRHLSHTFQLPERPFHLFSSLFLSSYSQNVFENPLDIISPFLHVRFWIIPTWFPSHFVTYLVDTTSRRVIYYDSMRAPIDIGVAHRPILEQLLDAAFGSPAFTFRDGNCKAQGVGTQTCGIWTVVNVCGILDKITDGCLSFIHPPDLSRTALSRLTAKDAYAHFNRILVRAHLVDSPQ